jgi:hypothetical protein
VSLPRSFPRLPRRWHGRPLRDARSAPAGSSTREQLRHPRHCSASCRADHYRPGPTAVVIVGPPAAPDAASHGTPTSNPTEPQAHRRPTSRTTGPQAHRRPTTSATAPEAEATGGRPSPRVPAQPRRPTTSPQATALTIAARPPRGPRGTGGCRSGGSDASREALQWRTSTGDSHPGSRSDCLPTRPRRAGRLTPGAGAQTHQSDPRTAAVYSLERDPRGCVSRETLEGPSLVPPSGAPWPAAVSPTVARTPCGAVQHTTATASTRIFR